MDEHGVPGWMSTEYLALGIEHGSVVQVSCARPSKNSYLLREVMPKLVEMLGKSLAYLAEQTNSLLKDGDGLNCELRDKDGE